MNQFKKLAGDTAIYGVSSIVGRFLNWWLMPLYVNLFTPEEYGIVTNLYAYVAFLMVVLTYGMETGFFRFASKNSDSEKVYSTSLITLFFSSSLFLILIILFKNSLAGLIHYPDNPEYILWFGIILAIDAFTAIPFARLRLNNQPVKFAVIKLVNIGFNIAFNLFFLLLCPKIIKNNPDSVLTLIYSPQIGVGYVFVSNLLSSVLTMLILLPEIFKFSLHFDKKILKELLNYSFPILIVGITGILIQQIDKILIPFLIPEHKEPMRQLGIYGAGVKIAVLMNMFIQAFGYAFEPFFFGQSEKKDDKNVYAEIMKYFVIFGLFIFLGMMLYIDVIKLIIPASYMEGFSIVPVIILANLFFGIYFNLSLWYKLTDMTRYGAYISILGAVITITLNFILIPLIGYKGSAAALLTAFFIMMIVSYYLGQKHYPVPYNLRRIAVYFVGAGVIYVMSFFTVEQSAVIKFPVNTILLTLFFVFIYILEKKQIKRLFFRKSDK